MKIAIVANEFFDQSVGRMGGFGWAASRAAQLFKEDKKLGFDPFFLIRLSTHESEALRTCHGIDIIVGHKDRAVFARQLAERKPDLLLFIDYRKNYLSVAELLPRVPIIVWMRDPRDREDERKLAGLRLPDDALREPPGVNSPDSRSLAHLVEESRKTGRPVVAATPAPHLWDKLVEAYGWNFPREKLLLLPNPVEPAAEREPKSETPLVLFLGRLDPYKRPWLFVALARSFPDVRFVMLGKNHFGEEGWQARNLPPNVELKGHVEGEEKKSLLARAWLLVNTSIHEGLAVSFLEALAAGTPILSCQDPGGVVSRYGVYVGRWDGDGTESLPLFKKALQSLLEDKEKRERLGTEGQSWIKATHTPERFLKTFEEICRREGLLKKNKKPFWKRWLSF